MIAFYCYVSDDDYGYDDDGGGGDDDDECMIRLMMMTVISLSRMAMPVMMMGCGLMMICD